MNAPGGERQLPLDLGHRAALGREDFLVAPSNRNAVAWIDRWPDWPDRGLVIWGPPACGKSHLAEVWRGRSGAVRLGSRDLSVREPDVLLGEAIHACVEDADDRGGALRLGTPDQGRSERALFVLYNHVAERGGHLLITANAAAARWSVRLADLRSRLNALGSVWIERPDQELIAGVLVKQFADRQLRVRPEVIRYLVDRIERSFAAAHAVVEAVDRAALEGQRAVTVPLARRVLTELMPAEES